MKYFYALVPLTVLLSSIRLFGAVRAIEAIVFLAIIFSLVRLAKFSKVRTQTFLVSITCLAMLTYLFVKSYSSLSKIIEHYQPESIFNLAAQSSVGKSFSDPIDTVSGIVIGTLNVLETCRKFNYKGRLFFASSSEIFGNNACGVDADCLKSPINTYGIAKKTSFELVKFYRELYNLKCVSGILFNHESHLRDKKFVIQKIIQGAKEISKNNRLKKLKVGNIEVIRDWGWAPEYMEGVQIMTSAKKLKDYVICSGIPISLKKFIEKVFSYYNLNWTDHVEIDKTLFRDSDIMVSYGDPTSINEELGWSAQISMDTIIKNMIELSE